MQRIRETVAKNPWIGWVVALMLLGVSVLLFFKRSGGGVAYSPESMTQMLTIRYTDTDEQEQIPRGRLEKRLREMGAVLDPAVGIPNPKTGKPTGILENKDDWTEIIARINREKSEAKKALPGGGAGAK